MRVLLSIFAFDMRVIGKTGGKFAYQIPTRPKSCGAPSRYRQPARYESTPAIGTRCSHKMKPGCASRKTSKQSDSRPDFNQVNYGRKACDSDSTKRRDADAAGAILMSMDRATGLMESARRRDLHVQLGNHRRRPLLRPVACTLHSLAHFIIIYVTYINYLNTA